MNDAYYLSRPTYAALVALLNNYNSHVGSAEHTNSQEETEITHFLTEISKTSVMQKTLQFLHQKGIVVSVKLYWLYNFLSNPTFFYHLKFILFKIFVGWKLMKKV